MSRLVLLCFTLLVNNTLCHFKLEDHGFSVKGHLMILICRIKYTSHNRRVFVWSDRAFHPQEEVPGTGYRQRKETHFSPVEASVD